MLKIFVSIIFVLPFFCANAQSKREISYIYDESKTPWENYSAGYADTFSVYGNKFRVRMLDTSYDIESRMVIEKRTAKWTVIDYFNETTHFTFSRDAGPVADINDDGYDDFLVEERWFYLVFLYNPRKHTFVKSGYYQDDSLNQKIPGYSNIYFDTWKFKFNNWWSYLYVVKDFRRINIGIIELKVTRPGVDEEIYKPAYISIRKITNNGEKDLERITQNVSTFDVKKFWQMHVIDFYNPNSTLTQVPNLDRPTMFGPISQ